ncbi:skin secretory protein xP2-like [Corythoichthys intestinalis]|uniref:skin secretory protein xP2-like n=1 Tax=Corythoichthys intestinalis TaxID=161448 RepID=UPI0025A56DFE|nr:skin secretory protein xP2-like [Corythoichthys intestinalis]XP_061801171.1 skin secretory protein xP2 [Nerophis lumbriciformis]
MADSSFLELAMFTESSAAAWFANAEEQFVLRGVSDDTMRFYHVVAALGYSTAVRAQRFVVLSVEKAPRVPASRALLPEVPAKDGGTSAPVPRSRASVPVPTPLPRASALALPDADVAVSPPAPLSLASAPAPLSTVAAASVPGFLGFGADAPAYGLLDNAPSPSAPAPLEVSEVAPLPAPLDAAASDLAPAPPGVSEVSPQPTPLAIAASLAAVPAPPEVSEVAHRPANVVPDVSPRPPPLDNDGVAPVSAFPSLLLRPVDLVRLACRPCPRPGDSDRHAGRPRLRPRPVHSDRHALSDS